MQLANFGLYNLRPAAIVRYWPLLLVAAGGLQIVSYVGLRDLAEGAGAVLLGLWLQASYFGLVHISSYRLWPLILTAVGLELSLSSFRRGPSDAFRGE